MKARGREKMKNDEFIRWLELMKLAPVTTSVKAYGTVIDEMLKYHERYKWHFVDGENGDLPEKDKKVECRTKTAKGIVNAVFGYHDGKRWCCGMNSNVFAWREIEDVDGKGVS